MCLLVKPWCSEGEDGCWWEDVPGGPAVEPCLAPPRGDARLSVLCSGISEVVGRLSSPLLYTPSTPRVHTQTCTSRCTHVLRHTLTRVPRHQSTVCTREHLHACVPSSHAPTPSGACMCHPERSHPGDSLWLWKCPLPVLSSTILSGPRAATSLSWWGRPCDYPAGLSGCGAQEGRAVRRVQRPRQGHRVCLWHGTEQGSG